MQDCAFCHGRDAGGGEDGPDLTRSKLVADDVGGDKIGPVVRNGRAADRHAPFHGFRPGTRGTRLPSSTRRKPSPNRKRADGAEWMSPISRPASAEAGKQYFNGAGKCSSCHSVTGDLAGLAKRLQGLRLEERLHVSERREEQNRDHAARAVKPSPANSPTRMNSTLPCGTHPGWYRSFPASKVKFKVDSPADAHAELLAKYTDDDIHNLMAYLQTLR